MMVPYINPSLRTSLREAEVSRRGPPDSFVGLPRVNAKLADNSNEMGFWMFLLDISSYYTNYLW